MESKAKDVLFNLALNEEADHESLLSYYRQRILDFDRERSEFLERRIGHRLPVEVEKRVQKARVAEQPLARLKVVLKFGASVGPLDLDGLDLSQGGGRI